MLKRTAVSERTGDAVLARIADFGHTMWHSRMNLANMNKDLAHDLLRTSWSTAVSDEDTLARLFYRKLFDAAPETEDLFEADLAIQGRKLVATLSFIIDSLDDDQRLLQAAGDLAIRHVDYNVSADQYAHVGSALIETLRDLLGERFDDQTEAAWLATYTALSDHMVRVAYA